VGVRDGERIDRLKVRVVNVRPNANRLGAKVGQGTGKRHG